MTNEQFAELMTGMNRLIELLETRMPLLPAQKEPADEVDVTAGVDVTSFNHSPTMHRMVTARGISETFPMGSIRESDNS
jgi:hypothetical protein